MERRDGALGIHRLIGRVCRLHFERANDLLAEVGVYRGQPPLLDALWRNDGLTQASLSDKLDISAATVSKMVQRMERAGLVERRDDPEDSRLSRVHLTDEGSAIRDRMEAIWREMTAITLAGLSDQETSELFRLLERLIENLEQTNVGSASES